MKEIVEHYGAAFLGILAGIGAVGVFLSCMGAGGILSAIISQYMGGICG